MSGTLLTLASSLGCIESTHSTTIPVWDPSCLQHRQLMKLRFVTLDSVAPIYFPLILHKPLLGLLLGLIRLAPTLGAMLRTLLLLKTRS